GICRGQSLELQIWVTWCALPDVSILRNAAGNILIRSERFDTLLVEYFNLQRVLHNPGFTGDTKALAQSAVAKWFAEFLLGLRQPQLALYSFERHRAYEQPFPNHTFRDEALASVPELEKAALQCFCLAHEIAHIIYPPRNGMDLDFVCDGMSLRTHLTWEIRQMGLDPDVQEAMVAEMAEQMDFDLLVAEIDADVSALGTIASFLPKVFDVSRAEAMRAALTALQAQSFLNGCKNSCRLLQRHIRAGLDREDFTRLDWIEGQYVVARTRVALRRAGLLLYMWDKEDGLTREPDEYRVEVDAMFTDVQDFLMVVSQAAFDETERLYKAAESVRIDQSTEALDREIARVLTDSDERMALFYILVAMGYPGGILLDLGGLLRGLARINTA
ncbi:hypothetical protein SE17_22905, partial [Kouleothrix aurantiaca]